MYSLYKNHKKMALKDDAKEWKLFKESLVKLYAKSKGKAKANTFAEKRTNRMKALFNIISSYFSKSGKNHKEWNKIKKQNEGVLANFNRKEWHMDEYFKAAYGYDWSK